MSIRKHANELLVFEKTEIYAQTFTPVDYAIWSFFENKINANSHPNISSFKTAIEEEWNKMSEELHMLKACKSFRRHVDSISEKTGAILSKFIVLCLSAYFVDYFLTLELILFYNRVVYY